LEPRVTNADVAEHRHDREDAGGGDPELRHLISPGGIGVGLTHCRSAASGAHERCTAAESRCAARRLQRLVREPARWYIAHVTFTIEIEREDDGRWLAEVPDLPGTMTYGQNRDEAVARVQALALRVIAERLEHREAPAEFLNVTFKAA
jgi:predicted RNase H-like HicB family nuclease